MPSSIIMARRHPDPHDRIKSSTISDSPTLPFTSPLFQSSWHNPSTATTVSNHTNSSFRPSILPIRMSASFVLFSCRSSPGNIYRSSSKNSRRWPSILFVLMALAIAAWTLNYNGKEDYYLRQGPFPDQSIMMQTNRNPSVKYHNQNQTKQQPSKQIPQSKESSMESAVKELSLPLDYDELSQLNEEFENWDPSLILSWAHYQLYNTQQNRMIQLDDGRQQQISLRGSSTKATTHPIAQVTSFGPTGLIILHMLSEKNFLRDVPIITLDTLHLFPESYQYYDTVKNHFHLQKNDDNLELIITKPVGRDGKTSIASVEDFDRIYGANYWKEQPAKYTEVTKTTPLKNAMNQHQIQMWITGRRRSQGGDRSFMDVLEFEPYKTMIDDNHANNVDADDNDPFHPSKGRWKLNPLAYWNYQQVWAYIRQYNIPYNPLYDRGYTSLGDVMTTNLPQAASANGENFVGVDADALERSGRFVGLNRTECGLHAHIEKITRQKQEALERGDEWSVPTLICLKCVDLTVETFEKMVTNPSLIPSSTMEGQPTELLLIEFYSPYCGGCQQFAPTLDRLADHISEEMPQVRVARFDITEHDIPLVDGKDMFEVEVTPTLYRVRYEPSFRVERYESDHGYDRILEWVRKG
mmetsp:Transcript_18044/g.37514  ORF Transcript_18044/g.37514 Transcript_18044/m.37514 type:complete len:638 (-) Transcript_18044:1-1914(-)